MSATDGESKSFLEKIFPSKSTEPVKPIDTSDFESENGEPVRPIGSSDFESENGEPVRPIDSSDFESEDESPEKTEGLECLDKIRKLLETEKSTSNKLDQIKEIIESMSGGKKSRKTAKKRNSKKHGGKKHHRKTHKK
jgi:hypothetical protein